MSRSLTEQEQADIITLADNIKAAKQQELKVLDDIIHNASYNYVRKLQNSLTKFAGMQETNFLEGKRMAVLIRTGTDASTYDPKAMGTTENFPCSFSREGCEWIFHLPPTPSIKIGQISRDVGRYTGYLVKNLIELYKKTYGPIDKLQRPVVVFEYGISDSDKLSHLYDADNRDSKKALDSLTGTFFDDDNVLAVTTLHFGRVTDESFTKIHIMESVDFADWYTENRIVTQP